MTHSIMTTAYRDAFAASDHGGDRSIAVLMERNAVSPENASSILREAARALDRVHSSGLTHGSICPAALRIDDGGFVEIAQPVEAPLEYLSPEQIGGSGLSSYSDQYAFAIIAYQLLAGQHPFASAGPAETLFLMRYAMVDPDSMEGLDLAMQAIFDRVFSPQPDQRYASCSAFIDELEQALRRKTSYTRVAEGADAAGVMSGTGSNAVRKSGPSHLLWWAASTASLLVFGLGLWNGISQRALDRVNVQAADLGRSAFASELYNGKLEICNVSEEPLHIKEIAAAYTDAASRLRVFNSTEHTHEDWIIGPRHSQFLSWRIGSPADWDGSALFYFLRLERDQKEYVLAGRWNGRADGCVHVD